MDYLGEDHLLDSPTARRLYHEVAATQPIVDLHTRLKAGEIAASRRWPNLAAAWLADDPEKWRLMRARGIDESFVTGDASGIEKFRAWAETIEDGLRNPVYDDSHLELRRLLGIDTLLSAATADRVWGRANAALAELDCRALLDRLDVRVLATCDDPADPLEAHRQIAEAGHPTRVLPCFFTAPIFEVDQAERFNPWLERLEAVSDLPIQQLGDFLTAITRRHEAFHELGCRLSDLRFELLPGTACDDADAAIIFETARGGKPVGRENRDRFAFYMLRFLARLDTARGWTMKLHLGNRRGLDTGPSAHRGFDAVTDLAQGPALIAVLEHLAGENMLPPLIIDSPSPAVCRLVASLAGSFDDLSTPGKIRLAAANRQTRGRRDIESLLDGLSTTGLLRQSAGFLSGSSSYLSLVRHERFRRTLCNLLGSEADRGEVPADFDLLAGYVVEICGAGIARFLGLDSAPPSPAPNPLEEANF